MKISSVSGIGLGTAPLAFKDIDHEQALGVVRDAVGAGVQLIDTALAYTRADAESYAEAVSAEAVAQLRAQQPDLDVLITTKGGHYRTGNDFPVDGTRASIRANCEVSLRTLGVDQIDLYQLHKPDPKTPLAESVEALAELRAEGKIVEVGLSNVSIEQLTMARNIVPIASVQNRLSFADARDLPTALHCAEQGIAYLAYSPMGRPADNMTDPRPALAEKYGVSVQQVTIAWLRSLSPAIIPLVGASRSSSILDSAKAVQLTLDPQDSDTITAAAARR